MEPALTNIGIVLPDEGYLDAVREITRRHGVLLVNDETHTLCAGPGGATAAWGLDPDLLVVGKPIAGGIPLAAYGMTTEVADRLREPMLGHEIDVAGVGGTLSANALALAASRATLSASLREEDFAVAVPLAERFTTGVSSVIEQHGLPWTVQRLGCRGEYWFCPPPRTGADAAAAMDDDLEAFLHLWCLNRGVLLTPFHNMALFSPHHTQADVDAHTEVFGEAVAALVGGGQLDVEKLVVTTAPNTNRRITSSSPPTSSTVLTMPRIRPTLASERPPHRPPEASISRTTRLPMLHANGPIRPQTTSPRIPSTRVVVACGWFGDGGP
jgi:glutamate-1-semialdehyde 2,1-aminomutase